MIKLPLGAGHLRLMPLALSVLVVGSPSCRRVSTADERACLARVPPWQPGASPEEKADAIRRNADAISSHIDSQVGLPFPDIPLRAVRDRKQTSLYKVSAGPVAVLNYGTGCVYAEADLAYFKALGWKLPTHPTLVILVDASFAHVRAEVDTWGHDAPVFSAEYPLPGWLASIRASPQTYLVATDHTLESWAYHLDGAQPGVDAINVRLGHASSQETRSDE